MIALDISSGGVQPQAIWWEQPMIIDSHNHLWFIDKSDLYWLSPELRQAGGSLVRDYLVPDLEAAFATVGVDRSVLVQAWHAKEEQHYWLREADDHAAIGAVIAFADLANPDVGDTVDEFSKYAKFRGLRVSAEDNPGPGYLAREDIRRGIRELGRRDNVSLDLVANGPDIEDVPRLAEENPDLPMMLDHLGKPQTSEPDYFEPWAERTEPLKAYPQIHFKLSGMLTEAGPNPSADRLRPPVEFMIETFGWERLLWGSDWPVCLLAASYRATFEMMMEVVGPMTEEQRTMLFGGNAAKYYRVS